jgi:pimeloyl-ACP methyl ester carboxylesterase
VKQSQVAKPLELEIPGVKIQAKQWGEPTSKPVLGVHGWLDNAATFDYVANQLEKLHLVSIDFPGHGLSEHLREGDPHHFFDLVPVFFDVAEALGWETFNILGHSMGSAAAFLAAGVYPERIEQMVLIDSLGPWTTSPEEAPQQMAKGLDQRQTLLKKSSRVFDDFDEALSTISNIYELEKQQVRPIVERGTKEVGGGVSFTYDLMLRGASLMQLTEPQLKAFMERIESDLTVIRPEEGWPVDQSLIEMRMSYLDELRLEKIAGNHHVHLQRPKAVANIVSDAFQ